MKPAVATGVDAAEEAALMARVASGSRVRFTAAVDPAKYPVLAVTVEKGDGDPAPTLPDVLRSRAAR